MRFKKSWRDDQYLINGYLEPVLGELLISEVHRGELEVLHAAMNHAPRRANQAINLLSSIFKYAINKNYVTKNPAKGIRRYPEKSREVFVPKRDGIKLLNAINELEEPFKGLLTFILATGCRKSEAFNLKWEDVDLDLETVTFRNRKNKKDLTLPLVPLALNAILAQEEKGAEVFKGRFKKPFNDIRKQWNQVCKKMGKRYWIHDLRRTLGSWLAQDNVSLPTIGAILGHSDPRSTRVYTRFQTNHLKGPIESALSVLDKDSVRH